MIKFDGEKVPLDKVIEPTAWRVILAPIHIPKQTTSGIYIPDSEVKGQEHVRFVGKVLKIGPLAFVDIKHRPHPDAPITPWFKVGDIVTTSSYAGTLLPCEYEGKKFNLRVVNEEEVIGVVPDVSILNVEK